MLSFSVRTSAARLLLAALALTAAPLAAQTRPAPADAQDALRTRPDLARRLRERFERSGMDREQMRDRLRAAGYPEDLLDQYITQGSGTTTAATGAPGTDPAGAARAASPATPSASSLAAVGALAATDTVAATRAPRPDDAALEAALEAALQSAPGAPAADSGTALFGLDMFRRTTSQFDPNNAGPVDGSYRLGPGDNLVLILTGNVELAHSLDVTREGFVVVPQVGQFHVANVTLADAERLLFARLARAYPGMGHSAGAGTRMSLSVARLRSNQVFVIGDVATPGSYRVSGAGTVLTALYAAGGVSANGSFRRVEVRRGGRVVRTVDLYDYLLRGDAGQDARLENGDVVFVPVHGGRVRMVGEVVRPATYELAPGETLDELVRCAGGFTERALRSRVQIERIVPPAQRVAGGSDRTILDVPGDVAAGRAPAVEPGDVVRVFAIANEVGNRIAVSGSVWNPGAQGFTPGTRLSEALRRAGGLRPDAFLGQVLVDRVLPDSSRTQLRATLRDTTGAAVNDLVLQPGDEVRVSSMAEFRPSRFVSVGGAVRNPGRYPWRDGMSMRALVQLAGGLDEGALLTYAEIARLPADRSNGATATAFRVPLDSAYLFERGPDGRYSGPPGVAAPTASAPEVPLHAYDNVLVLRQPGWGLQRTVVMTGEVTYPGRYALLTQGERLSDVIRRAGGLTPLAYADGAALVRQERRVGRVGIDLPAVLRRAEHRDNLLLTDGDSVNVPRNPAVVTVAGAVHSPIAVAYVPGRDMEYYVRAAGGATARADMRRAYVSQPSGKVEALAAHRLRPDAVPEPRAGATITVPERPASERRDTSAMVMVGAQMLGALAALAAVARR